MLWVALSYLLYAIANVATTGVLMYLFKYILNNSNAYSIVGVIPVITGLIMAPAHTRSSTSAFRAATCISAVWRS